MRAIKDNYFLFYMAGNPTEKGLERDV